MKTSKNEQDYLKAIYSLKNENNGSVSINAIAQKLSVSSPSATEMIKRLAKKELVIHKPYYGVSLTELGKYEARFILKSHRVWETFLFEKVGYTMEEVHDEAENLEHASSPRLIESLYVLMGYPATDPHGSEIPTESFWLKNEVELTLDEAQVDQTYHVTAIEEEGKNFFKKLEISLPHLIKVIDILEDKSIIIKEDRESSIVIPPFLQSKIHLMHRR